MDKQTSVKELAFVVPTDIIFENPSSGLSDKVLQRYHDVLHILFNKLQDGLGEFREFNWTFNKVIYKHSEVVREMTKRGIRHYYPINNLDKIHSDASEYSIAELSKKDDEKAIRINIFFVLSKMILTDAKGVEDDGDVDDFLEHGADDGSDVAKAGNDHEGKAEADADEDALLGNEERFLADGDDVGDFGDVVEEKDDVGGFDGDGAAIGAHGNAVGGCSEGGGVIDAVTNHGDVLIVRFESFNDVDFLLGKKFRFDGVDACLAGDDLCVAGAISGEHDDVGDAKAADLLHEGRNFRTNAVAEDEKADAQVVFGDEDEELVWIEVRVAVGKAGGAASLFEKGAGADGEAVTVDCGGDAFAGDFLKVGG